MAVWVLDPDAKKAKNKKIGFAIWGLCWRNGVLTSNIGPVACLHFGAGVGVAAGCRWVLLEGAAVRVVRALWRARWCRCFGVPLLWSVAQGTSYTVISNRINISIFLMFE